jgi:hypothetical protein
VDLPVHAALYSNRRNALIDQKWPVILSDTDPELCEGEGSRRTCGCFYDALDQGTVLTVPLPIHKFLEINQHDEVALKSCPFLKILSS